MSELKLPPFASEKEEADWWFDHRIEVGQAIVRASREGRLGEGTAARIKRRQELARRAEEEQNVAATGESPVENTQEVRRFDVELA